MGDGLELPENSPRFIILSYEVSVIQDIGVRLCVCGGDYILTLVFL